MMNTIKYAAYLTLSLCKTSVLRSIAYFSIGFSAATVGATTNSNTSSAIESNPTQPALTASTPRCDHYLAKRQVFWGDLHVHTALSMDAWQFGTRAGPDDAYRFARGDTIYLASAQRSVQIERPLDFAAITDHASDAGATRLCTTPGSASYDTEKCQGFRQPMSFDKSAALKESIRKLAKITGGLEPGSLSSADICGADGSMCAHAERDVWKTTQAAAAEFNDSSSDCQFTTFVAYEYTATPALTKIHRNVIFRNDQVPDLPISYVEEPDEKVLWRRLRDECKLADTGCDVLAIPHNPNLSNGHLFTVEYDEGSSKAEQAELAALRASMEPVMEIMQKKGDSECRNGLWNILGGNDELCNWEKIRPATTEDCITGTSNGALMGEGCVSRLDYARYALAEGLNEKKRLGVNPYQFGFIGSTDTHNATPGATEEWRSDIPDSRPNPLAGYNSGGMVAVWAEENSREAIFSALRRREVFATSGPRIKMRLFAGDNLQADICSDPKRIEKAYRDGVAMGGILSSSAISTKKNQRNSPDFLLTAIKDSGTETHPGNLLQRAQIIKAWTDPQGRIHQAVHDIAGGQNNAAVDLNTCKTSGPGHRQFCVRWQDPAFDPDQDAVYYARVVENPSCRSANWACALADEDEQPSWCDTLDPKRRVTQERAWSSPIWYQP